MTFLRLAWAHFKVGAMNELQYRVNFFIQLFQSLLALATGLIGLWLVFNQTDDLAGWRPAELLAVMGVHILMGGVIQTFIQPNMGKLMEDVHKGTLDYTLTKPADSQTLVSVREVRIWSLVDVLTGAIVLGVAPVREVWFSHAQARLEHAWAGALLELPGARLAMARFGASDCRCSGHLVCFRRAPSRATLAAALGCDEVSRWVPEG